MSALVAGAAEVEVVPSFTGFVTGVDKESTKAAKQAAGSFNSTMARETNQPGIWKRTGSRMASAIGGAFKTGLKVTVGGAVALLGYSLVKGFKRLDAIDQATHKLSGLGNSAKSVDAIMKNALASVRGTAFGMDEAATTAAGAVAAGIKPGKELTRTLSLTADAATIAGTSMGDMGAIFNKVATSNKIQGDTIAQLSDKGIPIVQLLGKSLHKSSAEVVDLARKGKINFAQFQTAMEQGVGGAAKKSGDTFTGAFANLKASLGRIGANLLSGVFPQLAPQTKQLTDALAPLEDKAKVVGEWLGKKMSVVLAKLPPAITSVKDAWTNLTYAWQAGAIPDDGPMGKVETFVAWLGVHLPPMEAKVKGFFSNLKAPDGTDGIGKSLDGIMGSLQKFFSNFSGEDFTNIFSALGKSGPIFNSTLQVMGKALGLVADHADLVAKYLPVILAAVVAQKALNATFGANSLVGYNLRTVAMVAQAVASRANAAATRASTRALAANAAAQGENTAATNSGILSTIRQRVASVASAVAQRAVSAASRAWAAAQWLLNAAMSANPIALVVIAIAALVAGFIVAYKKSETFRNIVNGAMNAVKSVISGVVDWFKSSFIPFFTTTIPNTFQGLIDWVKNHWKLILGIITGPIGAAVLLITTHWDSIKAGFTAAKDWVLGAFSAAWSAVKTTIMAPINAAKTLMETGWNNLKANFTRAKDWALGAFSTAWGAVKGVIMAPINAAKSLVETGWNNMKNNFTRAKDWVLGAFSKSWSAVKGVLLAPVNLAKAAINTEIEGVKRIFRAAKDAIGSIWGGLKDKITAPITSVLSWINSHFVNPINALLKKVGVGFRIPSLASGGGVPTGHGGGHVPGYAAGGTIQGPWRGPRADNVLGLSSAGVPVARVNPGEFITNVAATRRMQRAHPGALDFINRTGRLPGFSMGGLLGGALDWGMGLAGDVWSGIKKVGGFAVDMGKMLADPVGTIKKLGNSLLGGIASNLWGQAGKATMQKAVGGIGDKIKDFLGFGGATGTPGSLSGRGAGGWQWQWALIHKLFPGLSLTSAFRPGARTAGSGAVSYHALGRAIDLGGSVPELTRAAKWILANYGATSGDLLYSPLWGNMGIYHGRWYPQDPVTVRNHGNHVHWGYSDGGTVLPYRPPVFDNGGILAPGLNVVNNKTGAPEPLVRPGAAGIHIDHLIEVDHLEDGHQAMRILGDLDRMLAARGL